MVGDLPDIVARLWSVLPKRWFAEESPNLDAVLRCIATPWVWLHKLICYVTMQTRLNTATDSWLDLIATDYFGQKLHRRYTETDVNYRIRIQTALVRGAATRAAVSSGLEDLIGSKPAIFEPGNCMDTGAYATLSGGLNKGCIGLVYGQIGGWGNLTLPFQFFVSATRPATLGVSMLSGYGTLGGGYGEGAISYVDLSILPGHVTDQNIQSTLCDLLPLNTIAWLRIN